MRKLDPHDPDDFYLIREIADDNDFQLTPVNMFLFEIKISVEETLFNKQIDRVEEFINSSNFWTD